MDDEPAVRRGATALTTLPVGREMLAVAGVGLMLFALYQFLRSRYGRMRS